MANSIKAIIFDFGGVLIGWDPRNLYQRYFPNQPEAMEEFLNEIHFMEWNAQQDKGRSFSEAVALLSKEFPHRAELIRAYQENWADSITGQIDGSIDLLKTLKQKGFPVYGLSNWSAETFPIARKRYQVFELLDDIVLSGDINMIKPNRDIFEYTLNKIGRSANECLFIDDSEANIQTARQMGFVCIHFKSPEQLQAELQALELI
ncbi:MAG: HAD family phosphatase [Anaerolineales bacterium]